MHSDASGCVRMRSDTFGKFRKKLLETSVFRTFGEVFEGFAKTDVTARFLAIFRSGYTYLELGTTLGAHLGMGYRPGMASASAIGWLQSAAASNKPPWRLSMGG